MYTTWGLNMDEDLKEKLTTRLTVRLWPDAGTALGRGERATYAEARRGEIPCIGRRNRTVPTSWLRKRLGIETAA
jgi:hypothetical protein